MLGQCSNLIFLLVAFLYLKDSNFFLSLFNEKFYFELINLNFDHQKISYIRLLDAMKEWKNILV